MPKRILILALALTLGAGALFGGDGFSGIVNSLEREYGARQMKIPFMGLANAFMKVAQPYGVSGFRFAVFEDFDLRAEEESGLLSVIRRGAGKKWTPMIETRSSRYGERTAIYVRRSGGKMNMLLTTYEPGEATVIQMKVDPEMFGRWIAVPRETDDFMRSAGDR
jgi:hypothetical protein